MKPALLHCGKRSLFFFIFIISLFFSFFSFASADLDAALTYLQKQTPNDWTTMAFSAASVKMPSLEHLKTLPDTRATDYEKRILALTSSGFDPRDFYDQDLVEKLTNFYKKNQIGDENLLNDDFWGILALSSAGEDVNSEMIKKSREFVLANQNQDGGWGYALKTKSDTNDTAAALTALLEAGMPKDSISIWRAKNYLKKAQNKDGGFPFKPSFSSDGASTAWAVGAIYKLGEDPKAWQKQGKSPVDFLYSLQLQDGSFKWRASSIKGSALVSSYAVIALSGKSYPIKKFKQEKEVEKEIEKEKEETEKEKETRETVEREEFKKDEKSKEKNIDSDSDGLLDKRERFYKTDPKNWDTDGDGYSDGTEVKTGFDPRSEAPCPIKKFSKNKKLFVFGKRRLASLEHEQCYARYLKTVLKKRLGKRMKKIKNWPALVNAFVYGDYSVTKIVRKIRQLHYTQILNTKREK